MGGQLGAVDWGSVFCRKPESVCLNLEKMSPFVVLVATRGRRVEPLLSACGNPHCIGNTDLNL